MGKCIAVEMSFRTCMSGGLKWGAIGVKCLWRADGGEMLSRTQDFRWLLFKLCSITFVQYHFRKRLESRTTRMCTDHFFQFFIDQINIKYFWGPGVYLTIVIFENVSWIFLWEIQKKYCAARKVCQRGNSQSADHFYDAFRPGLPGEKLRLRSE